MNPPPFVLAIGLRAGSSEEWQGSSGAVFGGGMTFSGPILGQMHQSNFSLLKTQSDVDEQIAHVRESCVSFPNLRGSFIT